MDALAERWLEDEEIDRTNLFGVVGQVDDPEKADSYLYVIGQIQKEIAENSRIAEAQIQKVTYWCDTENAKLQRRIDWLSTALENFARQVDKKTIRLPNGTLKLRAQQPSLDVDDEMFLASNPLAELIRIIPEKKVPDRKAIRQYIQGTGEIPEGCTWTEPDGPSFSFEVV